MTILGILLLAAGIFLLVSFTSYLFHFKMDQSQIGGRDILNKGVLAQNSMGKIGAWVSHISIQEGVGITAFFLPVFLLLAGIRVLFKVQKIHLFKLVYNCLFFLIWLPVVLGYFSHIGILHGVMGYEINSWLEMLIGKTGVGILLLISLLIYIAIHWKVTPDRLATAVRSGSDGMDTRVEEVISPEKKEEKTEKEKPAAQTENLSVTESPEKDELTENLVLTSNKNENTPIRSESATLPPKDEHDIALTIETGKEEDTVEQIAQTLVEKQGEYDPRLELPKFKFPTLDLLKKYDTSNNVTINQQELEQNKNRIVETLGNYGIGISEIKATIGPTVTLYEIVPEAGIRISKIKNLEDDIALSLSALGIRIIAPIPGRGTIGIEVPNSKPTIVSMRSVIAANKFQNAKMELPIAFGKTIENETFVADLAKMPHLLMAGATGQGKSVGLNAIITSLLYKKHPTELKFVLVDPKKVELTLYSKIERHYLAKLPDSEEAIITDNAKVINTLNSLCIEMDDRYDLLKNAFVRNIKEYNDKFRNRKLNPEHGHRYLPYIVLVVDEFADLIMTAGKEVETPIARLAQLARAVGIHLIIATQRPSVNVITGIIKANFPARAAFRVTSKIDSRTILDSSGADQLIGKGDMLFTTGNEPVRLQCAFVDTPEVAEITEFIGSQRAFPDAMLLPEYEAEGSDVMAVDLDERDKLFDDAARVVVISQQGSASMLQRKLKLGYNRAGRIIDQLEAAGIVGPFEGSKARQVLIQDEQSLEQLLNSLGQK